MGQIVSSATPSAATTAIIDSYVSELPNISYERSLGTGRFIKTIRCRQGPHSLVVVKIFVKPSPSVSLDIYTKQIQYERSILQDIPNTLPYSRILETERAGYMIRGCIHSNLYDRISTRPFLDSREKIWIVFQVMSALSSAHSKQIFHGDIKTENILVTTWNWAYLSDFSNFKPVYLPEDNPSDFSYFFDTSSRRVCYLAPERFYAPGETLFTNKTGRCTPAMDIFSMGCTIAELFLEGIPMFSFSQLLRYRSGEYDPSPQLDKIEDENVRSLVKHMIQLDQSKRLSAADYLYKWRGTLFPHYFFDFLHPYMITMSEPTSWIRGPEESTPCTYVIANGGRSVVPIVAEADAKIGKIWSDFDMISSALQIPLDPSVLAKSRETIRSGGLPVVLGIPGYNIPVTAMRKVPEAEMSCLAFTSVVCSYIRNVVFPSSKLYGIDLLLAFGFQLSDEHRIERVIPFLITMVRDESAQVRAAVIRAVTQLLSLVETITASDANLFPEYILPHLKGLSLDPDVLVRCAFAQCIATLAETALRFLELSQLLKSEMSREADKDANLLMMSYDTSLKELQETIQEDVAAILADVDPVTKRGILADMPRLCIFFGRQQANDVLLGHMITYLNDQDWQLRCAFFESVVGVVTFSGRRTLDEYVLPIMIQALTDAEEYVAEKVLASLASLAELGLISKIRLKELVTMILPLVCHPSIWIRYASVSFVSSACRLLPSLDVQCVVYPSLRPFLRMDIPEITDILILEALKMPVSRLLYDQAALFASKSPQGGFGKDDQSDISTNGESALISKLRDLGMSDEDREKLFSLKYFIFKSAQAKTSTNGSPEEANPGNLVLKALGVTAHTVFLTPPAEPVATRARPKSPANPPQPTYAAVASGNTDRQIASERQRLSRLGSDTSDASRTKLTGAPASSSSLPSGPRDELLSTRTSPAGPLSPGLSPGLLRKPHTRAASVMSSGTSVTAESEAVTRLAASGDPLKALVGTGDSKDNSLRKLLENKTAEYFPPPIPELGKKVIPPNVGPVIVPLPKDNRSRKAMPAVSTDLRTWRPEGTLVSHLAEHKGRIHQLKLAPDHNFFATCSDDGTVKIWDTQRLETNVSNCSRLTYSAQGGHIRSIAFCENTHSFISVSDRGSLHVCRIEYVGTSTLPKYNGIQTVREVSTTDGDFATMVHHYDADTQSMAVYATAKGKIHGLDLRTMKVVWSLDSPAHHGFLTSFDFDPRHLWMATATQRGIFSVWDLRFGLRLKSWSHPAAGRIHKISCASPTTNLTRANSGKIWDTQAGKIVSLSISGQTNEISSWDIESGDCQEVWCIMSNSNNTKSSNSIDSDTDVMSVYSNGYAASLVPERPNYVPASTIASPSVNSKDGSPRCFVARKGLPYMIAGGGDRKIRLWDLANIENSYIICGHDADEVAPRYSSHKQGNLSFNLEYVPAHSFSGPTGRASTPSQSGTASPGAASYRPLRQGFGLQRSASAGGPGGAGMIATGTGNTLHLDAVVDLEITEVPYPMIVSAGRDGIVKVWK
ncbi:uncharacterized protein BJ171DRAFT_501773 [Polychytrium aggregatum]|uniref:uncharacterized protein n=1 Tax=Polychytrium aggregatum TaxID=110093 RepID=UPI0022FE8744|nr:uncharacterized protein BJ171DRAFT_501773 [Polychytrium aggregatum]KAI9205323.1 hypothetical protein BJ171DRAFT_501773 [Polychytrium aggregatum]